MPAIDPSDRTAAEPLLEPLTRRERDILALLAQQRSAAEIAEKLTLAVSSVKWYIQQVYGKLGVNSRAQAVNRGRALGLVEPSAPITAPAIPSAPAPAARKHNLKVRVTRFFGRETEIANLKQRLAENRLVTLTGSGGVGKTRLSLEVAAGVLDDFSGGVWLVELAPLTDPGLVPQLVADVLGVRETPGRTVLESLTSFLRGRDDAGTIGRQALLVLDNCEHLLEACARLAEDLLQACPGLKVLASSREPLGVAGEAVFGVRSLPFPDPAHLPPVEKLGGYTAINLFVDRARLVLPEYETSEHNAAALARICQRLDGIPLAIEMAAARINVLNATQLAERLDDAFRVLTGGNRTALPRQQTLRATIDWSYALLSVPERVLLQRLSVFAGGANLEAIEGVCADQTENRGRETEEIAKQLPPSRVALDPSDILDVLSPLVAKSMVIADRRPSVETRYHLLETVRQYAREKLNAAGEGERLRSQHLRYFVTLAEEAEPALKGHDQMAWLNRLDSELDNLRAALEYSQAGRASDEAEVGLRLVVALDKFWHIRGHWREAFDWLEEALARRNVAERSLTRAFALQLAASTAIWKAPGGDAARRQAELEESIEIFRAAGPAGRRGLAYALISLGELRHRLDDFGSKLTMLQESVEIFREVGDKWGLALALHMLAATLDPLVNYLPRGEAGSPAPLPELPPAARNDHAAERELFETSLALFRELGDRWAQSHCLGSLAHLYGCWGDRARGRAMNVEAELILREFADLGGVALALGFSARDALAEDDLERAARLLDEWLAVKHEIFPDDDNADVKFSRVELARRLGDYEQANRLLPEALAAFQRAGNRDWAASVLELQGRVARSQGDTAAAHTLCMEALVMRREAGHPVTLAHSFHALALLAAERGGHAQSTERAARLFGAAEPYHAALYGYHAIAPIWRPEHERGVATVRAALGEARFATLWAEGEAMRLEEAYEYALESW